MLHCFTLWKPNECSRTKFTPVSYKLALKDVHSVTARVSVMRVYQSSRIPQ